MPARRLFPDYASGEDFAVEVDGVRFRFNAEDFASRVGAAAVRLGVVTIESMGGEEREDLVALAAHGRVARPASRLAAHIDRHRDALLTGDRDLVHWLRRMVFHGAWIDQQVTEGRLEPVFEEARGFRYRNPAGHGPAPETRLPDWSMFAYGSATA